MARRLVLIALLLGLSLTLGWAAQYEGEGEYGGVSLHFTGHVTTAGSCQQLAQNLIRCQVPAGSQGTINLTATVTPSSYTVAISAISLPSWASFRPVTMYGTATTSCTFSPRPMQWDRPSSSCSGLPRFTDCMWA